MHRIDLFAETLSLRREDWTDGKASPLYNLLSLYYSLSVKETVTPRTYTTLLTLYYALWSLLPHTHDQLNQADCLDEEIREQAKTLINTLVPPNDLFQQINHSLFFMIAVKEVFDGWKPPSSSLMIFKEQFFDDQMIVDPANPEHIFYQEYLKLLKIPKQEQPPEEPRRQEKSQRPKLTYAETLKKACQERFLAYVQRKLEPRIQISNLLTQDEP